MLMSAGLSLPKKVFGHGFLTKVCEQSCLLLSIFIMLVSFTLYVKVMIYLEGSEQNLMVQDDSSITRIFCKESKNGEASQ